MSGLWMLGSKQMYVIGVSVRLKSRCYSLISFRQGSLPRTMFCVYHSSPNRWRITCSAVTLTLIVSVNFFPHFQSPRWKRLALEMICLTLPRRVDGHSKAGRNCATQSKTCAAKESRGYLSARSSTRCIHAANCSSSKLLYSFPLGSYSS